MDPTGRIIGAMTDYFSGDPRRIHHFLKVYGFARAICQLEGIDKDTQRILEAAALTHDIGIKNSEKKYGSAAGHYQQIEGPPEARRLLQELGCPPELTERVCWLIARHHTYDNIQGMDYQILVEADFLVNAYEDSLPAEAVTSVREKVFRTASGTALLNRIYLSAAEQGPV